MKKIFLFIIVGLLLYSTAVAQTCPRKIYDCRGLCGMYVDQDGDHYCDYSYWSNALLQKRQHCVDSIAASAALAAEKRCADSLARIHKGAQDKATTPREAVLPTAAERIDEKAVRSPEHVLSPAPVQQTSPMPAKPKYDVILLFVATLALYLFTFFAARRDVIKKSTHRKIWNGILLLTFLVSGLLGLFLAIQLNYNFKLSWFATLLYYHVEFGIAMAVISIFHVLWHLKYWKNIFVRPGERIKGE